MLRKKFCKILFGSLICLSLSFGSIKVNAQKLYNSVNDFVIKSYEIFLNRNNLDDIGIEHWSYLLGNHNESLYNYMISLVTGEEFLSKNVNDKEFIDMIYELLLNKVPSEEESSYWVGKIQEENNKLNDINSARYEVCKIMFNENFFNEFSYEIGTTPQFQNLNNLGVAELREDYDPKKIEYINNLYKDFNEFEQAISVQSEDSSEDKNVLDVNDIISLLPIFSDSTENEIYEELKSVSSDNIKRLVYALDYKVKLPYDIQESVYISPFIQLDIDNNDDFITLGLSITARNLGKLITKSDIILGNEFIDLEIEYTDQSKYEGKGISVYEFKIKIESVEDLKLLNKILSSDLSKLRFTFDDSNTYVYNLYEKDRVRNTLRFMTNLYSQIVITSLI